jgi:hypothetical protein
MQRFFLHLLRFSFLCIRFFLNRRLSSTAMINPAQKLQSMSSCSRFAVYFWPSPAGPLYCQNQKAMIWILLFLTLRRMVLLKRQKTLRSTAAITSSAPAVGIAGTIAIIACALSTSAQQRTTFDIIFKDEPIGVASAMVSTQGNSSSYLVETHVNVQLIYQIRIDLKLQSRYEDGIMQEASLLKRVNGTEKINNQIYWLGERYSIISQSKKVSSVEGGITRSISTLYFTEPEHISKVFSETFLTYVPVKEVANGTYTVTLPDGRINSYYYQNGACSRVSIETMLGTVYLVLNSSTPQNLQP